MRSKRVDADAALSAKAMHIVGVNDFEAEAELLAHLALPLLAEARRTDYENLLGLVPQHEFLGNQASLDGFPEADVVGDQQTDARHPQRFN
ncbi:MAG: hypothetical protein OXF75_05900 [Acidimicrobiaceae bacterium]|nr:hypothetical protein [Acidimicrobiaceae bacterium]